MIFLQKTGQFLESPKPHPTWIPSIPSHHHGATSIWDGIYWQISVISMQYLWLHNTALVSTMPRVSWHQCFEHFLSKNFTGSFGTLSDRLKWVKKRQVLGEFKTWQLVIKSWDTERGRTMIQQRITEMKKRQNRFCGKKKGEYFPSQKD